VMPPGFMAFLVRGAEKPRLLAPASSHGLQFGS